jgi:hypothetical protein
MVKIVRSRRRTLSLQIQPDGILLARAPWSLPEEKIHKFINDKQNWIIKHKAIADSRRSLLAVRKFIPGEKFLYLGRYYALQVTDQPTGFFRFAEEFFISNSDSEKAGEIFAQWYKVQAKEIFKQRLSYYYSLIGCPQKPVKFNSANTRWGSCGPQGSLNFNWRLIMAPIEVIDYVIVHELVHLWEKNHSTRFWSTVSNIYPAYKIWRQWLKENGWKLVI